MCQHKKAVEGVVNNQLSTLLNNDAHAECLATEVEQVATQVRTFWSLSTSVSERKVAGIHNLGTRVSSETEAVSRVGTYTSQIEKGGHQQHNQSLLDILLGQSRVKALWKSSIDLGTDDRSFSYVRTCQSCGGRGRDTCGGCHGKGTVTCSVCYGSNRRTCGSCGGSGRYQSGNTTSSCGACYGSGSTSCTFCTYHGYDNCTPCGGSGEVSCSPCKATGYFTHEVYFEVRGIRKARLSWDKEQTSTQTNDYLNRVLKGGCGWVPLEQTVHVRGEDIQRDEQQGYPFEITASGQLLAVRAKLSLQGQTADAELYGEGLLPLTLGLLGDKAARQLADEVSANLTAPEKLNSLLDRKVYDQVLAYRKNTAPTFNDLYAVNIQLLKASSAQAMLSSYQKVVAAFSRERNTLSYRRWLSVSSLWMLALFCIAMLASAAYHGQLQWGQAGFPSIPFALDNMAGFWEDFDRDISGRLTILGIAGAVVYIPARLTLLSVRARSFWGNLWGFLLAGNLGLFLVLCFASVVDSGIDNHAAVQMPGISEFTFGAFSSLQILPEIIALGLTLGLLRCRRVLDIAARKQTEKVSIAALSEDLGYSRS